MSPHEKGSGDPPGAQHLHGAAAEPLAAFWSGNINLSMLQISFFFSFPFWVKKMDFFFFFSTLFNVTATKRCCWYSMDPLAAQPSGNLLPSLAWPLHTSIFLAALFIQ